ncbi:MAG: class I adenylate-forming enzyme family protein [Salinirussus sp.]
MPRTYEGVQDGLAPPMRELDTVGGALAVAAERWPDSPYLTFATTGETWTFGEAERRAREIAGALMAADVSAGDRVGLYLTNSPDFVHTIYACSRIGAIETPINWQYREREVRHAIETAEIGTVVVEPDEELREVLTAVAGDLDVLQTVITIGDGPAIDCADVDTYHIETLAEKAPSIPPDSPAEREDPVAIMYTSGTTGLPKPTVLSNESFLLGAKSFLGFPLADDDTNYNPYPLFHANNQVYSMLGSAIHGSPYVLGERFSTSDFIDVVTDFDVTSFNIIGGVPKMLESTYGDQDIPDTSLEYALGPIATGVWEAFEQTFDLTVFQLYSQTESLTLLANHPAPDQVKIGAIGQPMFPDLGHEAWVESEDGDRLPPDTEGELVRTDPGHMLEYRDMPEKTRETLRNGAIYSGDIVTVDADGYFYYVDRKKFMVRRAGENISAQQVEDVIDEHEGVAESAIIPVPDEIRGEEVKAMVMPAGEVNERDIVDRVAAELADYKVPRYVEFVDEFPRTPTERIRRVQLADEETDRDDHGWDRDSEYADWQT